MPALLLLLFVVLPIAELYVIVQVAQGIGIWWTLLLLVADSVLGTVLMRAQGRATWRRFREATQAGRVPAREVVDGALVILGGAFLLAPGFITDVLGFALLLPPTRAALRGVLVRAFGSRLVGSLTPFGGLAGAGRGRGPRRPPGPDDPVDATAHDVPPRRLP